MSLSSPTTTVHFYTRDGCHLCDEARDALQVVLEDRARRGDVVPRVREVNLSRQPELEADYGSRIPVIAVGSQQLALATSARQISAFLDRVVGLLA